MLCEVYFRSLCRANLDFTLKLLLLFAYYYYYYFYSDCRSNWSRCARSTAQIDEEARRVRLCHANAVGAWSWRLPVHFHACWRVDFVDHERSRSSVSVNERRGNGRGVVVVCPFLLSVFLYCNDWLDSQCCQAQRFDYTECEIRRVGAIARDRRRIGDYCASVECKSFSETVNLTITVPMSSATLSLKPWIDALFNKVKVRTNTGTHANSQ